jgi:hypothetical protein
MSYIKLFEDFMDNNTIKSIASMTGVRPTAVETFLQEHDLDANQVLQTIGRYKLNLQFPTLISGDKSKKAWQKEFADFMEKYQSAYMK